MSVHEDSLWWVSMDYVFWLCEHGPFCSLIYPTNYFSLTGWKYFALVLWIQTYEDLFLSKDLGYCQGFKDNIKMNCSLNKNI